MIPSLPQQRFGRNAPPLVVGQDAPPMKWAERRKPCGPRIPALVGPLLIARIIDPAEPPEIGDAKFVVVDAMPGECPVCDDAQGMAIRDTRGVS